MSNTNNNEYTCELCLKYYHSLTKLAFSYLKNMFDAQDVVQDVFMAYIRSTPSFESSEHERAWLLRVTINKCKNHLKQSKHIQHEEIVHYSPPETQNIEILSAVMSLPEKYRVPVHLFYYEDMSIAQIAIVLDEKSTTVGTRLSRARKLLKDILYSDEEL